MEERNLRIKLHPDELKRLRNEIKDLEPRDLIALQLMDYRRNNPKDTDEPFWYPFSATISAGSSHTFRFEIPDPRDRLVFLNRVGWSNEDNTTYDLKVDDGSLVVNRLDFEPQSQSMQNAVFTPPKIVSAKITLKVTNNDAVEHTYRGYFGGWYRYR